MPAFEQQTVLPGFSLSHLFLQCKQFCLRRKLCSLSGECIGIGEVSGEIPWCCLGYQNDVFESKKDVSNPVDLYSMNYGPVDSGDSG